MPLEDTSHGGSKRVSIASPLTPAAPVSALKDHNESSANRQQLNTKRSLRKLARHSHVPSPRDDGPAVPTMKSSSPQPTVQPRKSSTSLFSLFSKPKVEKARGYGGEGPAPAAIPPPTKTPPPPPLKSALKQSPPPAARPPSQALPTRPPSTIKEATPRAPSALSNRNRPDRRDEDLQRLRDAKTTSWSPPPLFQAFARSVKNGLAEVLTSGVVEKPVAARPKTSHKQEQGRTSLESDGSAQTKMTIKALSSSAAEAQKIVVLLDDGHILQYPQHGPTNRLPEKVLGLCQDSAAMTCDTPASNKFAVRIVQSVAQKSFSFSTTFSRLTRRSEKAKREASSFIFVFAEQQEAEDWLRAIRTKIAELCLPESIMLNKETSIASKVDSVIGEPQRLSATSVVAPQVPEKEVIAAPPVAVLPTVPERRTSLLLSSPTPAQTSFDLDSDSERKGSLEMLEEEAERLISATPSAPLEPISNKRISDVPSYASSNNVSMGEQSLNAIRNSARMSYLSNGTALTSRTSSLTSEPSPLKSSPENTFESKNPYRTLSSYQGNKRRSLLLAGTSQPPIDLSSPTVSLLSQVASANEQPAPVVKPQSPAAPITPSQMLTALPEVRPIEHKATTPPILEEDERPESIVADLPPPSTWTSKLSPKSRNSMIGAPMTDRQLHRISSAPTLHTMSSEQQSRRASQAFRIPLKVNTDSSAGRPLNRTRSNRNSFSPDPAAGAEPKVFTLEAKVDPRHHRMSMGSAYSSSDMRARSAQRLSLFPSPLLPQDSFPEERRASLLNSGQPGPENVPPRRASLQRPTSLQVRTDRAPFLSSIRQPGLSTSPPQQESALTSPSTTAVPLPIRSLKPSRSTSAPIAPRSDHVRPQSPTDPFLSSSNMAERDTLNVARRQSYVTRRSPSPASAPPLAPLPMIPGVPMGNSFAQQRMSQRHSYMPRHSMMAAAIPVASLGPPAPPPNAPLPAPPGGAPPGITARGVPILPGAGSRRTSAANIMVHAQSGGHGNGLGIQVGS